MPRDHNSTRLSGNLTTDPRPFTTHGGPEVAGVEGAEFTLAVNDEWTDRTKGHQERTDYIGVVCYGPWRERALRLQKGDRVLVTGKLRNEEIPAKEPTGKPDRKTKLRANSLETLRSIVL
jgi:single stranded DNA-binding protein